MPRLPYGIFLWVFGVSNAAVWFVMLYGLGYLVHHHFAADGQLQGHSAATIVCVALLLPIVLALQGSIVNLRAQFLAGRFLPPAALPAVATVRNPWQVALIAAATFWAIALPLLLGGLRALLPDSLGASQAGSVLGGIGALAILLLSTYVSDREFRRYAHVVDGPCRSQLSALRYVVCRIGLPWGVANLVINAALGWIMFRQSAMHPSPAVTLVGMRADLVAMAFMISVFMALAVLPEVETDFHRNLVHVFVALPPMPRLWTRYGYAAGVGVAMYAAVTATAALLGATQVSLAALIVIRGLSAGVIAAGAAGMCALWALGRCVRRRDADNAVRAVASAPLL